MATLAIGTAHVAVSRTAVQTGSQTPHKRHMIKASGTFTLATIQTQMETRDQDMSQTQTQTVMKIF